MNRRLLAFLFLIIAVIISVGVMMLSAKGRDIDVNQGLALGADAYVTKPFSTKALLATVRELLPEDA